MRMSEGLQSLLGSQVLAVVGDTPGVGDVSQLEATFKTAAKVVAAHYETAPRAPMRKALTAFKAELIAAVDGEELTEREQAFVSKLSFTEFVSAYDPTEQQVTEAVYAARAKLGEAGLKLA